MKLDDLIDEKTYLARYNLFENQIKDFLEQKSKLKNENLSVKTQILLELLESLYRSYSKATKE